jgi:hypothetical protein
LTFRSAKTSGVVSASESKTLMTPRFSATNTRPSRANRTAVGFVSPLNAIDSWKPLGSVAALDAVPGRTAAVTATSIRQSAARREPRP